MTKLKGNKKIGLALGGGVVLGAAHIGVLKALDELKIKVSHLAGTSIGSLVAALFAFGKSWEEIKEIARELKWLDISRVSLSKYGLLSNDTIGNIINDSIGSVSFNDAQIPLAVIATDIVSGEKVVISEGSIAEAVMASTCIPGIFNPVEINNTMLVDGGIVENVPTTTVEEMGAEYVIGVDLNSKLDNKKPENIIEILLKAFDYALHSATKLQTKEAHFIITPDLGSYNAIDLDQIPDLIDKGYEDAMDQLREIV